MQTYKSFWFCSKTAGPKYFKVFLHTVKEKTQKLYGAHMTGQNHKLRYNRGCEQRGITEERFPVFDTAQANATWLVRSAFICSAAWRWWKRGNKQRVHAASVDPSQGWKGYFRCYGRGLRSLPQVGGCKRL